MGLLGLGQNQAGGKEGKPKKWQKKEQDVRGMEDHRKLSTEQVWPSSDPQPRSRQPQALSPQAFP